MGLLRNLWCHFFSGPLLTPHLRRLPMAKKIKKQKAGMLKRKQNKKSKKALQRRQIASRPSQQPSSEKELQKLLRRIPILAYEPELEAMRLDSDALKAQIDAEEPDPKAIINILNDDFIAGFKTELQTMEERVEHDVQKNLMVKGMLYALEHDEMPHFVNPLIVAIYLKTKADLEDVTLIASQILKAVEKYEMENMELIEALIDEAQAVTAATEAIAAEKAIEEDDEEVGELEAPEAKTLQLDSDVLDAFQGTLGDLDDEAKERVGEDIEVFLEDYVTVSVDQWDTALLDDFLGNWFIENANPVEDDMRSMQTSLERLFGFLGDQGKISGEAKDAAMVLLKDQETYLQRMSA